MKNPRLAAAILMTTALAAPAFAADPAGVVAHYADIAEAGYGDSLATARALRESLGNLVAQPSQETLDAARSAWLAARIPYQQTEAFRFGNALVDDFGRMDFARQGLAKPQPRRLGHHPARMAHGLAHIGQAITRLLRIGRKAPAVGGRSPKREPSHGSAQAVQ